MENLSNEKDPLASGSGGEASLKAELSVVRAELAEMVSRLSEQAQHNAVALERERAAIERANELSRFSDALRRTLDSLVCWVDLPAFVGCLLSVVAEQLQAPIVEYWSVDEHKLVKLVLTCRDGKVFPGSDVLQDSRTEGIEIFPGMLGAETLYGNAPHFIGDDLINNPEFLALHESIGFDMKQWLQDRGVHRLINLPLLRGEHFFGALCAYLPQERTFDQTKINLAHSFKLQLALSIRLAELSEQSKQAAVLYEREEGSKTRAEESKRANAIVQATLDQLATKRDLRSFPRTILAEAMKQLNAQDGVILLLDYECHTLRVSELIANGASPSAVSEIMSLLAPPDITTGWQALVLNRSAVVLDIEKHADMLIPGTQDWLRRRGNRCLIAAPVFSGADMLAFLGIGLPDHPDKISKISLGLIQQLTQQAFLAIQLTRLAEASQKNAILLERQRVVIQEKEHLSREIHDKLTQGYAAILMQQNALRRLINNDPATLHHLDIIERLSKDNLAEARKTMDELRVDPLGPGDLRQAMEDCVHKFDDKYTLRVILDVKEQLPPIPRYLELELCRIVGEAVTNACKHSRGTAATVTIQPMNGSISILVQDNGIGFDAEAKSRSFGIASMYERAARAGAELTITSASDLGTQVYLTLSIG